MADEKLVAHLERNFRKADLVAILADVIDFVRDDGYEDAERLQEDVGHYLGRKQIPFGIEVEYVIKAKVKFKAREPDLSTIHNWFQQAISNWYESEHCFFGESPPPVNEAIEWTIEKVGT